MSHHSRFWLVAVVVSSIAFAPFSLANDGFYQGSGSTLSPIENRKVRVLSERLDIAPLSEEICYAIEIPKASLDAAGEPIQGAKAEIGAPVPCPAEPMSFERLRIKWSAKAEYDIEATSDQKGVQIGFPVPQWDFQTGNSEGMVTLPTPGVTGFRTWQDGVPIAGVEVKRATRVAPKKSDPGSDVAFVWKTDLKKGRHRLVTEYSFGSSYSSALFAGREYPANEALWFDHRPHAKARMEGDSFPSESIEYALTPIRLWKGGVPKQISVRVRRPKGVPVFFLTPIASPVDCVDEDAIYMKWTDAYPKFDLKISYPLKADNLKPIDYAPISTDWEFSAWSQLLHAASRKARDSKRASSPDLSCTLVESLKKRLPKDGFFHTWTKNGNIRCVESCRPPAER